MLINLIENRGRNLVSGDLVKGKFFQKKSEEQKNILTNNWNHIDDLANKFNEFQKSLENDRKNLWSIFNWLCILLYCLLKSRKYLISKLVLN